MPVKTGEQKKAVQAKVSDENEKKCVMNCRVHRVEKGIEK